MSVRTQLMILSSSPVSVKFNHDDGDVTVDDVMDWWCCWRRSKRWWSRREQQQIPPPVASLHVLGPNGSYETMMRWGTLRADLYQSYQMTETEMFSCLNQSDRRVRLLTPPWPLPVVHEKMHSSFCIVLYCFDFGWTAPLIIPAVVESDKHHLLVHWN